MHSLYLDLLRGARVGSFSGEIQKLADNSADLQHLLDALVAVFKNPKKLDWATIWDIVKTAAHLIDQLSSDPSPTA